MRVQRLTRLMAVAATAATAIIVGAPAAGAHPRFLSADPKPSTVVPGPVDRITVRFDEVVRWEYSQIRVEDTRGNSLLAGKAQTTDREAILPLVPGSSGPLQVSWRLVGIEAHPVVGSYVFGIDSGAGPAAGSADLDRAIRGMATTLGEGRIGSPGLTWAIRGGRSLEIILLYLVLGILMLRAFVLKEGRAITPGPGAATVAALRPSRGTPPDPGADRGYRMMRTVGIAAALSMPVLFVLYAARLDSALGNVAIGKVVFSSLGETWAIKTVLWIGIAAGCAYGLRHSSAGARRYDLLLLGLASAVAVAFGFNTNVNGLSPGLLWTPMMFGHLMVTAFWAGGLVALLLVVFPTGDPARIWPAVSRFSTIMTITIVLIVASGLAMLVRLLSGNLKGMWCSDFGVVAGFKMAVVGIAIIIGIVNNRVVAYQKRSLVGPINTFRPRKERSIASLRRLIAIEAVVLGSAVLLSGALGESQLPSVFKGQFFPADLQETVRPGLFGSGCQ